MSEALDDIEAALKDIDAPPRILYAFRETHRLVTEENRSDLTPADLQEWNAVIDEYEDRIEDESDSIEICFSAPARSRKPHPSPAALGIHIFSLVRSTSTGKVLGDRHPFIDFCLLAQRCDVTLNCLWRMSECSQE